MRRSLFDNLANGFIPLVTVVCLGYVFSSTAAQLVKEWGNDTFSHSFLVPPLAALIAWHRLAGKKIDSRPSHWGFALVALSLAALIVSELSTFRHLAYWAMLGVLIGLSLVYFGRAFARAIAISFFFLLFAVPFPLMFYNALSLNLKLLSSTLGASILGLLGYSVFQDGNIIDLGSYQLQVVEACSGLRYLFPLMCFAFLVAYFVRDRFWKKVAVFLSSVPIAIGMNALRITFVGITVGLWGPAAAEAFVHYFEGYVVFFLCLGVLALVTHLLLLIPPRGGFAWDYLALPREKLLVRPSFKSLPGVATLAVTLGVAALFLNGVFAQRSAGTPLLTGLAQFPLSIGDWRGAPGSMKEPILKALELTDYWMADYARKSGDATPVNLYIAYYASQQIGKAAHSPSTCVPGGGWAIERSEEINVPVKTGAQSRAMPLVKMVIRSGAQKQIVYYWFDERGRTITSQAEAKWYLLVDSLLLNRSDGALVRLTTPLPDGEKEEEADRRLQDFLAAALPIIESRIPGR